MSLSHCPYKSTVLCSLIARIYIHFIVYWGVWGKGSYCCEQSEQQHISDGFLMVPRMPAKFEIVWVVLTYVCRQKFLSLIFKHSGQFMVRTYFVAVV